jgi:hypothetical protein
MASKRVVTKLHYISNDNTGDDPGNELEVYDRFDEARLVFDPDIGEVVPLASFNLFDRSRDNAQDIVEGTAFIVESAAILEIFPGEFLQISGFLTEHDTFGQDDQLGSRDVRIKFQELSTQLSDLGVFRERSASDRKKSHSPLSKSVSS